MPSADNRPTVAQLVARLAAVPDSVMAKFGPPTYSVLQTDLLDKSIAYVEDVAATAFNGRRTPVTDASVEVNGVTLGLEVYDGNTTNQIVLRKRPAISVQHVQVVTPILGYTRIYTPEEIKLYRKQAILKVFTYKLAVEQALLQTVDYQAWGSLFPPLPQAVQVAYTYGYPLYDESANQTSMDGGVTWQAGDLRDPEETNWLKTLQEAALNDAAGNFLLQLAGLQVGLVGSMSFDGYSRSLNTAAFAAQGQAMHERRDELLKRRRRPFYMATLG